jgi:hypothetical protein
MTIGRDWVVLDTHVWIFGLRKQPDHPACTHVLQRLPQLHVKVPRRVETREGQRQARGVSVARAGCSRQLSPCGRSPNGCGEEIYGGRSAFSASCLAALEHAPSLFVYLIDPAVVHCAREFFTFV